MADVVVRKCDECESLEGVVRYTLKDETRSAVVDLCPGDSKKPLSELLERYATKAPAKAPKARKAAPSARKQRVTTMAEIEELKKSS